MTDACHSGSQNALQRPLISVMAPPLLPHSREARTGASEIKFLIDTPLGVEIAAWARRRLDPDPHGGGPFGDEYRITSLYLDTDRLDVLHARGSFGRSKYRVRRYGASDVVFLERKLRKPGLLHKRRTLAPLSELPRLKELEPAHGWPGLWFHRRLLARRLQPTCELSYTRIARALHHGDSLFRLTVDSGLRARSIGELAFGHGENIVVNDLRMVLELKYQHDLPALFKELLGDFSISPVAGSKYRLGMAALGHV